MKKVELASSGLKGSRLQINTRARNGDTASHIMVILRHSETAVLILLVVLILVFGFGGYRMGPGLGYYGGGGLSLILTIVVILLLLKVI
jgi:hypothetical protein